MHPAPSCCNWGQPFYGCSLLQRIILNDGSHLTQKSLEVLPSCRSSQQQGLDWVSKGQRPELQMERFMPLSSPQDQANLDPSSAYMFAQPLPCSVPIPSLPYRFTREQSPSKPLSQALFLGNPTKGRASGAVRGGRLHKEQGRLLVALPGPHCGLVGRLWELHWADKQTGRPRGSPA